MRNAPKPGFKRNSCVPSALATMPGSIEEIDSVIQPLFRKSRQVVFGFEALFIAQSAAREGEARVMRWDAEREQPGWISPDGQLLYVRRGSSGLCVPLHADLAELLGTIRHWRDRTCPESPWFFPSPVEPSQHVRPDGPGHVLHKLTAIEGCPRLLISGLRAFYVSTRLSQGIPYYAIARELGLGLSRQSLKGMFDVFRNFKGLTFARKGEPPWSILFQDKPTSELSAAEVLASIGHDDAGRSIQQVYGVLKNKSQCANRE